MPIAVATRRGVARGHGCRPWPRLTLMIATLAGPALADEADDPVARRDRDDAAARPPGLAADRPAVHDDPLLGDLPQRSRGGADLCPGPHRRSTAGDDRSHRLGSLPARCPVRVCDEAARRPTSRPVRGDEHRRLARESPWRSDPGRRRDRPAADRPATARPAAARRPARPGAARQAATVPPDQSRTRAPGVPAGPGPTNSTTQVPRPTDRGRVRPAGATAAETIPGCHQVSRRRPPELPVGAVDAADGRPCDPRRRTPRFPGASRAGLRRHRQRSGGSQGRGSSGSVWIRRLDSDRIRTPRHGPRPVRRHPEGVPGHGHDDRDRRRLGGVRVLRQAPSRRRAPGARSRSRPRVPRPSASHTRSPSSSPRWPGCRPCHPASTRPRPDCPAGVAHR